MTNKKLIHSRIKNSRRVIGCCPNQMSKHEDLQDLNTYLVWSSLYLPLIFQTVILPPYLPHIFLNLQPLIYPIYQRHFPTSSINQTGQTFMFFLVSSIRAFSINPRRRNGSGSLGWSEVVPCSCRGRQPRRPEADREAAEDLVRQRESDGGGFRDQGFGAVEWGGSESHHHGLQHAGDDGLRSVEEDQGVRRFQGYSGRDHVVRGCSF